MHQHMHYHALALTPTCTSTYLHALCLYVLEGTFIPEVFKERTWTKLLNPVEVVYSEIVREFFSNAAVDGDRIECWVRQKKFVITREIIQDFLEVRPPSQPIEVQYEDRLGSTEEEIDRFTSAPESSAQPSSSTLARGPDRLDRLLDRVDQMYTMLDSHVQHTATQFAYIQGQIIALSSQIEDLSMARGSNSESNQF